MGNVFPFKVFNSSASICLYNEIKGDRDSHFQILHKVLNFMENRGFQVGRDPRIQKDYKCLNKDHWYGRKGNLEFKAERYPAGWKIEFFQNIVFENSSGGFYDFDKYEKMPYIVKLLFRNEVRHIKQLLEKLGCIDTSKKKYKLASDKIKADYVESWHHEQKSMDKFELEDLNGETDECSYNNQDRDKKTIYNGQIKYFRDWSGRLARGIVYHNINNMWWVILNDHSYTNEADFYLFDPTQEDFKIRRLKKDVMPKEYLLKKEKLKEATSRELVNELKRRGIKNLFTKARGENFGS